MHAVQIYIMNKTESTWQPCMAARISSVNFHFLCRFFVRFELKIVREFNNVRKYFQSMLLVFTKILKIFSDK